MRQKTLVGMVAICWLVSCAGVLRAQRTQGTISGTVSDSSGAVIPNAEVTITHQQTGTKRVVTTNESGFYTATALDPGTYTVTAKIAGFKILAKAGIELHVADEVVVPIVLEVGTPTQTVEVTAAATMVETRSGEVSNVIGTRQIQELPLNGRSFVQLTLLVPGAAASDTENPRFTGLLGGVDISMSGSPANSNAWLVDGVDNVDHGSGRTILVYPSVDSIEEFKVERSSYGADSPSASGAQVNLVTKSGTNKFHGSVYEFWRNDLLDANNFFLNQAGKPKAELRSNNFGYTFGGPIKKDKLFFFWSQEWRREVRGVTRLSTVPTDEERVGNFNVRDPANPNVPTSPFTGLPFPNNTIPSDCSNPAGCLSTGGLSLMQLFPHPNATPNASSPWNWVAAVPTHLNTRQEQVRVDYNFTSKTNLMVRFTNDYWENPAPNFGSDGGLWGDTGFPTVDSSWSQPSKSLAARLTHTFGPSMVNTFQFSYSNNRIYITNGLGASATQAQFWGPNAVPGGAGKGGGWGPAASPGNGGQVTGNGLADLLLKGAYFGASEQSSQPRSKVRWKDVELYYADTWRVTPRLTLQYGARWSILPPSIQADNLIGNFIPSLYNPAQGSNPQNGMIYPAGLSMPSNGIPGGSANLRGIDVGRALRNSSYDTIAPRFGFAFDPTGAGKWAIRGGFGTFFGRADLSQPIGELLLNPPFNTTIGFGNGRTLDDLSAAATSSGAGVAGNAADTHWKTQDSYQWNLTVEREILRDTKLEVAYVGNHGNHLPLNYDLNSVAPQNRLQWAELNFTPGADSNSSLRNALRQLGPLEGTNSLIYMTNGGTSSYHAFQAYLLKRFSHNFSMSSSYSFSKLISDVSLDCCGNGSGARIYDTFNFRYNRGPADFDRPHVFSTNVIYDFPAFAAKPAYMRYTLGSWEATAVYSYSTGVPLTVALSQNLTGLTSGGAGDRPDLVGNPAGPNTASGGWLNPNAFRMPVQLGRPGTDGVGILHGPPTNNTDIGIFKNFKLTEKMTMQFRFETFNTLNHTQFFSTSISGTTASGTKYQISGPTILANPFLPYQPNPNLNDPTKPYNPATDHFTGCSVKADPPNPVTGLPPGTGINPFPNCNTNAAFGLPTKARDPRELQLALKLSF